MSRNDDARTGRTGRVGTAVLAFLLGALVVAAGAVVLLALGVLVVEDDETTAAPGASPTPAAAPTTQPKGDVPESCLRSAEYNEQVSVALDDLAVGVRDQEARTVQEALDAIQDVRPEMDAASQECQAVAGEPADDGATEESATDDGAGDETATDDGAGDETATDGEG